LSIVDDGEARSINMRNESIGLPRTEDCMAHKSKHFNVPTPKRRPTTKSLAEETYPYYAGYAESFAREAIQRISSPGAVVFDPWNGAGTTTHAAATMGRPTFGTDLNPVMVVVSKAKCASEEDARRAQDLFDSVSEQSTAALGRDDPLALWVGPRAAGFIRHLVLQAFSVEKRDFSCTHLEDVARDVSRASRATCFLLLAIFRAVKAGAAKNVSSNPTWTKQPSPREKWGSVRDWRKAINEQLERLTKINTQISALHPVNSNLVSIECASSEAAPLEDGSVDVVLTSPPYCTRIDYAIATLIELAVLGLSTELVNATLRKDLLGTTSIRSALPERLESWGETCNVLLSRVFDHPTKGSRSYYYKNFVQYFDSLYRSVGELARVVKADGVVCAVLQGSHYKECPVDLPKIFAEMASGLGFALTETASFDVTQHLGSVNQKSLKYRKAVAVTEQVLVLQRES